MNQPTTPRSPTDAEPLHDSSSIASRNERAQRRQAFKVTLDLTRVRRFASAGIRPAPVIDGAAATAARNER
jgi:hypothetical protein